MRSSLPAAWLLLTGIALGGCGRTDLDRVDAPIIAAPTPCNVAVDCAGLDRCQEYACVEGVCEAVSAVNCDDGDPCTTDACDMAVGCVFEPRTSDADGDGFRAPLPGMAPGPDACGDDCNDASAAAFPGGVEACDGVDNDCNGIVDDGARFGAVGTVERVSATGDLQANAAGLVHNGDLFAATISSQSDRWTNQFLALDGSPPVEITKVNNDTFSGPLLWTGEVFATTWEDRRDGDYEIYFNRLDRTGRKLGPDLRLSEALGFSLHPKLAWDGGKYFVVWDDRRTGEREVFFRMLNASGRPTTDERVLVEGGLAAEAPAIAVGSRSVALAFKIGEADDRQIAFRVFDGNMENGTDLVQLSTAGGVTPRIEFLGGRYIVTWSTREGGAPGPAIWGAAFDESGAIVAPARALTSGDRFARTHTMLPLGDRFVLAWAGYAEGPAVAGGSYDIFTATLDDDLRVIAPRQRLTSDAGDSVRPHLALGTDGSLGVLFDDNRDRSWQAYFTRLSCIR